VTIQLFDPDGYAKPRWLVALEELEALGVPDGDGPTDADWDE
jgi:hypothetical protein